MKKHHWGIWGLPLAITLLCGCAGMGRGSPSTTVSSSTAGAGLGASARAAQAPSIIYVSDFYLSPEMITTTSGPLGPRNGPVSRLRGDLQTVRGDDPAAKARKLVTTLGETITRELNQAGYRTEYRPSASGLRQEFFPAHAELPREGWLLGGWFEQVQEGNRVEAATVGFGHGSSRVSIEVIVSDLAGDPRQPFLVIGSENAQHNMPGGLVTMNPYAMAAKFVLARGQTDRDVKAMGAAIAKTLVQYLEQGAGKEAPR